MKNDSSFFDLITRSGYNIQTNGQSRELLTDKARMITDDLI